MARQRSSRSAPLVLVAASVLAVGCSATRIDPLEFDYYSNPGGDPTTAPSRVDPLESGYRAETAPIVPIGGGNPVATPPVRNPEPVTAAPIAPASVVVQKGDSLYGISARYLGSGKRWPEIARLNGLSDRDVTRLAVGRELKLPAR